MLGCKLEGPNAWDRENIPKELKHIEFNVEKPEEYSDKEDSEEFDYKQYILFGNEDLDEKYNAEDDPDFEIESEEKS